MASISTLPLLAADGAGTSSKRPADDDDDVDAPEPPAMSLPSLLLLFLGFGARAFGGPVAQINLMKDQLVTKERWISLQRFTRAYAAYQVLPGPEATELAIYFGILSGGRVGGVLAGLGFIAPGFCLMLLASFLYVRWGLTNGIVQAVFAGLAPAVSAMMVRAAHKIGETTCRHHAAAAAVDWRLFLVAALAALESTLGINFFFSKAHLTLLYVMLHRRWFVGAAAWAAVPIAAAVAVIAVYGPMDSLIPQGVGAAKALGDTPAAQFIVGLLGGLFSFGGAYTAIPFMRWETVTSGQWVSSQLFLDSLAICGLLPTPLVMFATMIGYGAGGVGGALLMTLGMFLPAFVLPVALHYQLDWLVNKDGTVAVVLDGLAATTVGLIAVAAVQFLRTSVTKPVDAIIFFGAAQALYGIKSPWAPVLVIGAAGLAGYQLFYSP